MKKYFLKRLISFALVIFTFLNFASFKLSAQEEQTIKLTEINNIGKKNLINFRLKISKKYRKRNNKLIQEGISLNNRDFKVYNVYNSYYILTYDNIKFNEYNYAQISYLIDLNSNKIVEDYKKYEIIGKSVIFNWYVQDKLFINIKVNNDGSLESNDSKFKNLDEYLSYLDKSKLTSTTSTKGVCELAIDVLCGAGGTLACNTICALTAVATRIGATACTVVCALISAKGCDAAKTDICG